MRRKQKTAAFLAAVLAAGMLTGCQGEGKKDNETEKGNASPEMGRYMEEEIALPESAETVLGMQKSADGNPLLFGVLMDETGKTVYLRYEYKDGGWEETELSWLSGEEQEALGLSGVQAIRENANGSQAALYADENFRFSIRTSADGEVKIPYLTEETQSGTPIVSDFLMDGSGNYWIYEMYSGKISAFGGKTYEKLLSCDAGVPMTYEKQMFLSENGDVLARTSENGFTLYDRNTLEEKDSLSSEDTGTILADQSGEDWYLFSESGISRVRSGNELAEVIFDGSMGMMGSPAYTLSSAICGRDSDFYALYQKTSGDGGYVLERYVFDKSVPAVPEKTLQVFGLEENSTVQQAIHEFQKAHTDVQVVFNSAGKAAEEVTSEDIRTLNTELLSGNGADVLILDGLPAESYVEKGILADLTSLADSLTEEDAYLENILRSALASGEKLYGLPVKFSIPLMYGNSEAMEALSSLDSLEAYVNGSPDVSVFGEADYQYIAQILYMLYQDELFTSDGKIDQENLKRLLEVGEKLAQNCGARENQEMRANRSVTGGDSLGMQSAFDHILEAVVMADDSAVVTNDLSSLSDSMTAYGIMHEKGLKPQSVGQMYTPLVVAGVNGGSKQKELAEEFIKFMLSSEVQSAKLDDGFPVLRSALESLKDEVTGEYASSVGVMMSATIGGQDIMINGEYPTGEEMDELFALVDTLNTPADKDRVIWQLYTEEAQKYLEGGTDADTAVKTISQKVDTYLAE